MTITISVYLESPETYISDTMSQHEYYHEFKSSWMWCCVQKRLTQPQNVTSLKTYIFSNATGKTLKSHKTQDVFLSCLLEILENTIKKMSNINLM